MNWLKAIALLANGLMAGNAFYDWHKGELPGFWCAVVVIFLVFLTLGTFNAKVSVTARTEVR